MFSSKKLYTIKNWKKHISVLKKILFNKLILAKKPVIDSEKCYEESSDKILDRENTEKEPINSFELEICYIELFLIYIPFYRIIREIFILHIQKKGKKNIARQLFDKGISVFGQSVNLILEKKKQKTAVEFIEKLEADLLDPSENPLGSMWVPLYLVFLVFDTYQPIYFKEKKTKRNNVFVQARLLPFRVHLKIISKLIIKEALLNKDKISFSKKLSLALIRIFKAENNLLKSHLQMQKDYLKDKKYLFRGIYALF